RHPVGDLVLEEVLNATPTAFDCLEDVEQFGHITLSNLCLPFLEPLATLSKVGGSEHVTECFLQDVALRQIRVCVEDLLEGDVIPLAQLLAGTQQHVTLPLDDPPKRR